jgi:MoxR-like ATPase
LLTLLNERLFDNGSQRLQAPLLTLVGASNELPESEELDALYDRFLLRRQVAQVSTGSAAGLARLAAGRGDDDSGAGADASAASSPRPLQLVTVDDLRSTAAAARLAVDVPDSVVDLLVSLRTFLQERCEPPVYVSDRRFMKSVALLQVAAYGDGRDSVSEYDCLLLEHVLGSRPDDARKVRAHVLDTIGSDPGLQQAELVLLGLFGRACALLGGAGGRGGAEELAAAAEEAATLAALLEGRHAEVSASLDGGFPELRATLWQSGASARGAAQHLTPPLAENRKRAEDLLREARVLHACLEGVGAPSGVLERMLPKRFKQYSKGIAGGAAAASAPAAR